MCVCVSECCCFFSLFRRNQWSTMEYQCCLRFFFTVFPFVFFSTFNFSFGIFILLQIFSCRISDIFLQLCWRIKKHFHSFNFSLVAFYSWLNGNSIPYFVFDSSCEGNDDYDLVLVPHTIPFMHFLSLSSFLPSTLLFSSQTFAFVFTKYMKKCTRISRATYFQRGKQIQVKIVENNENKTRIRIHRYVCGCIEKIRKIKKHAKNTHIDRSTRKFHCRVEMVENRECLNTFQLRTHF